MKQISSDGWSILRGSMLRFVVYTSSAKKLSTHCVAFHYLLFETEDCRFAFLQLHCSKFKLKFLGNLVRFKEPLWMSKNSLVCIFISM